MIIAVDLDHTLCVPNENGRDSEEKYGNAEPIEENIKKVNKLFKEGHKIIIYTARRMLTHKGNVKAVEEDVGQITRDWLRMNGVLFTDIVFGKIYYDLIIDDKAINVKDWS